MASPPFDIAHTLPEDDDIVAQFPQVERTFRDIVESWLLIEHNVQGRHDKVSLDDQNADLDGIADVIRIWNKDGALRARVGTGSVTNMILDASLYALLASPALTGTPTAPSATVLTDSTQIATTEFAHDLMDRRGVNAGNFKALVVQNNSGTPNTQVDVDAEAVTVETSGGVAYRLRNVDVTINAATNGANGMDTGGLGNNGWYAVLVIYNPSTNTTAGLLVAEANYPSSITLPSGYTAYTRVGWMRTNASAQFRRLIQRGRMVHYVHTTGVGFPQMDIGVQGNFSGTLKSLAVGAYVPNTASVMWISLYGGSGTVVVAPNNSFDIPNHATLSPPTVMATDRHVVLVPLETTNIYWASDVANGSITAYGWEDNL